MKKLSLIGAFAALLPMVAFAAYVGAGDSVSAPASGVAQNIYLAGGTVNVSSPVAGDVMAVGGTIVVSAKVNRDVMAAGGNISIVGGSAEDIRIAGGNLTVGGKVSGEIMAAGGQITVTPDAVIDKSSFIVGGSLIFAGTENGDLTLAGGNVRIDGTVNGNISIKRAESVVFGSRAVVKGTVEYSAPKEAVVESGAQLANAPVFNKIANIREGLRPWFFLTFFSVFFVLKLIAVLAAAYFLWYLRRRDMETVLHNIYGRFWGTLLRGFGLLVLIPVASIILFISVVGWIPAAILLSAYGVLLVLASPVAAIVAASFLMALFKKNRIDLAWYHILLGFAVLKLIVVVPVLGWLACFVVFLIALGATGDVIKAKFS